MSEAGRLAQLATQLLMQGGNLQSTTGGLTITASALTDAIEKRIESNVAAGLATSSQIARLAAVQAVKGGETALNKIAGGVSPTTLSDLEIGCLEAIVEVTGRPATRFNRGGVQMPESLLGDNDQWRTLIAVARSKINRAASSVGCITVKGSSGRTECIGTGWCAAGQLIVTNRHVVAELVQSADASPTEWKIEKSKQPMIDFEVTGNPIMQTNFQIAEVAYCAVEEDFDAAIVRVSSVDGDFPPALKLDWDRGSLGRESPNSGGAPKFVGNDVYVVGHPYRQLNSDLTASVFGRADGTKRWSPGRILRLDPNHPALDHDCSTLGGSSGSCVLTAWNHSVVGLHFGGVGVDGTGKGDANRALVLSRLGSHPLATILKTGKTV